MTPQAQLVMILWPLVVFFLFSRYPPPKAVSLSFIIAWLFLPHRAEFSFPGIPDYDRMSATCYTILLFTWLYDAQRIKSFRLTWLDAPMLIWCVCPFVSSITNDLGAYDGLSAVLEQTVGWGLPYFLGRIYLNNLLTLREFAVAAFASGLVYVPLCLYEVEMSPQLHNIIYGYFAHPSGIRQAIRYGGYRPSVFMQHGLQVGVWMMAACLIGVWLWKAGTLKTIWNFPMKLVLPVLLVTFILVKSTGAWGLLALGFVILYSCKWFRTGFLVTLMSVCIVYYLLMGVTGTFNGDEVVAWVTENISPERAQSLAFRFDNEELLRDKAILRPWFGWGGWGRNRVYEYDRTGELVDISVTDSLWIQAYGMHGIIGLFSLTGALLIPVLSFMWSRYPPSTWFHPKVAPAAALGVVVTLYMLDNLLNSMENPIFVFVSGGIAGLVLNRTNPEGVPKRKKPKAEQEEVLVPRLRPRTPYPLAARKAIARKR